MEIFFSYNIVAAALVCGAAIFIFGAGAAITKGFISDERKKINEEDDTCVDVAAHWRVYRRVTAVLFLLVLAWTAWCIHDNYAVRAVAKAYEPAVVELAEVINEAAKRPFDKRCQFNGHDVSENWIASDTFPCADFGSIRLWKNSQIVVSKYNSGNGSKIFVGRRAGEDMNKVAIYDPADWWRPALYYDYLPSLYAGTDPQAIHDIADTIRNALR